MPQGRPRVEKPLTVAQRQARYRSQKATQDHLQRGVVLHYEKIEALLKQASNAGVPLAEICLASKPNAPLYGLELWLVDAIKDAEAPAKRARTRRAAGGKK